MRRIFSWSLMSLACVAASANAQQPAATRQPNRVNNRDRVPGGEELVRETAPGARVAVPHAQAAQQGTADQQIAALVHGCAQNEVEISRLAQSRAESDDVKQFAATMIKEHTQQAEKMARLAGNLAHAPAGDRTQPGGRTEARRVDPDSEERAENAREEGGVERAENATGRDETRREDKATSNNARNDAAATGHGGLNWNAVHAEVGQQCLQSMKQELSRYKGVDFDKAYLGQQIVAHMIMVDELKVLRNHATGQLKQELDQGIEGAQQHLAEARKLMDSEKDIDSDDDSSRKNSGRDKSNRENPNRKGGREDKQTEGDRE